MAKCCDKNVFMDKKEKPQQQQSTQSNIKPLAGARN